MVTGSDGPRLHTASRDNNLFDARLCAMQIIQLFPAYAHCTDSGNTNRIRAKNGGGVQQNLEKYGWEMLDKRFLKIKS